MGVGKMLSAVKPYLAMILLQVGFAGMYVISVATLKSGMSHFVLVVYRNIVATAVMTPFALWFERNLRPKMTFKIFLKVVGLALLEPVLDQNLYYMGAKMTSAGFMSAMVNTLPSITFIMALVLRMEKVRLRSLHSQAKVVGTLFTVIGAVLMILYHGPVVPFPWSKAQHHGSAAAGGGATWLMGTIAILAACVFWSGFFVLQANTLQSYPAELSVAALVCGVGSLMSGAVALVAERGNYKAWVIGFDTRLFTAAYAGVVCSGVAYYVQGLVSRQRGPVFVTAFSPLCMIVTALMGSVILKEEIRLGSVIGAVIIVVGLYALIWGKTKDVIVDVSAGGGSKGASTQLPITSSAPPNGNGHGHVMDVEMPVANDHN